MKFHWLYQNLKAVPSVWQGETNIATYETDSGESSDTYRLENMFDDENLDTFWRNHEDKVNTVQTVTMNFLKARVFNLWIFVILSHHLPCDHPQPRN